MKRITSAIAILVLVLTGVVFAGDRPATIDEFLAPGGRTWVIAHRGFSGRAPENTLAAISEAIAIGADMAEIDVTLTADDRVVVIHDETLDRTTNGAGRVADHGFDEIRNLDAGSWFAPQFAGEKVPTLEEILDTVKGRILLNVEIKSEAVGRGISDKVAAAIRHRGMADQVIVEPGVKIDMLMNIDGRTAGSFDHLDCGRLDGGRGGAGKTGDRCAEGGGRRVVEKCAAFHSSAFLAGAIAEANNGIQLLNR